MRERHRSTASSRSVRRLSLAAGPLDRWPHRFLVPALLVVCAVLAITSLREDSMTFDETAHLTAGFSYLQTGDFRLEPEHPPLPKLLAALPLLWMEHNWPSADTPGWQQGNYWQLGRTWLFGLCDGEKLLVAARGMMVGLLPATCLVIYALTLRLFGRGAGLLACALAAVNPTLLAHGRLVNNDVYTTLAVAGALLASAMLLERVTWGRLGLAAAAAALLLLGKFSWLAVVPALALMGIVSVVRRGQLRVELRGFGRPNTQLGKPRPLARDSFGRRVAVLGGLSVLLALVGWLSIWSCYGWRYSAFRGADRDMAMFVTIPDPNRPAPQARQQAWETLLCEADGGPQRGMIPALIGFARRHELLPEAYLYGLAYTRRHTAGRMPAYLNGEIYQGGRAAYFPIAYALKTPLATLGALLAGVAAIVFRKTAVGRDPTLLVGALGFGVVFWALGLASNINISERYLLPVYPVLLALGGAAAGWLKWRVGRAVGVVALAGSIFAVVEAHPNYLAYFNELAGGPAGGYRRLADSNADWGQNLKRLARYAQNHPDEAIKLAYFGSADPRRYGFTCELLPSFLGLGEPRELTPGSYVLSVNQWLGLYDLTARDSAWTSRETQDLYRLLARRFADPTATVEPEPRAQRVWRQLRWSRLLYGLRRRQPDERIGYGLFVYRLTAEDIARLTQPP